MAKSKQKKLVDKLDKVCADIIKIRDDHLCQMCGKRVMGTGAHCSHVVPKSRGYYVRWDLINLKLLCMHCHLHVWHKDPLKSAAWFKKSFPARQRYLDKLRDSPLQCWKQSDLESLLLGLQKKLKQLEHEQKGKK